MSETNCPFENQCTVYTTDRLWLSKKGTYPQKAKFLSKLEGKDECAIALSADGSIAYVALKDVHLEEDYALEYLINRCNKEKSAKFKEIKALGLLAIELENKKRNLNIKKG